MIIFLHFTLLGCQNTRNTALVTALLATKHLSNMYKTTRLFSAFSLQPGDNNRVSSGQQVTNSMTWFYSMTLCISWLQPRGGHHLDPPNCHPSRDADTIFVQTVKTANNDGCEN